MKILLKYPLIPLILPVMVYISNCTKHPQPIQEEPIYDEGISMVPQVEDFDAFALIDEESIPLPPSNLKYPIINSHSDTSSEKSESRTGIIEMPGFRVQIFVTKEEFDARQVEEDALLQFEERVYLTFDSPNYKIRVGDCKTRSEANDLRQIALQRGYPDAWVVRCKILTTNR